MLDCQSLYFCSLLASSTFNFDGRTIAYYDATYVPLHNRQDELRLRFKTNYPHGVLFYAKGTQNNDYLSVELRNGSIYVGVDLGRNPIPSEHAPHSRYSSCRFDARTSRRDGDSSR